MNYFERLSRRIDSALEPSRELISMGSDGKIIFGIEEHIMSLNRAVKEARETLDEFYSNRKQLKVVWELDNFADEGEERYYPLITLHSDYTHLKEFLGEAKEDLYLFEGKWYQGEGLTAFETLEDAQDNAKKLIAEKIEELCSTGHGPDAYAQTVSSIVFSAFPHFSEILSDWVMTKWGSWYLTFQGKDESIYKISVRDHSTFSMDAGKPDASFYVSKNWTPEEVGDALKKAIDYIQERI